MGKNERTTLTIKVERFETDHTGRPREIGRSEDFIVQDDFEKDGEFMERATVILEALRYRNK